jgi:hypothetical protein
MQDIPLGQLLVVIAFILFPLINWLLRRIQRRFETQSPPEPPRQPAPRTFAKPPPQEVIDPTRERVPALKIAETPPRPRTPRRNKPFFGNRRDLRRAMVLKAVLGPCRAVDEADR